MLAGASEMMSSTKARSAMLRRLLLAALQAVLVLLWAEGALAEEAPPAPNQKVGMCGLSAQSIAAPPPIYPSDEAVAKSCSPPSEEIRRGLPAVPNDPTGTAELQAEKSAVLSPVVRFPKRVTSPGSRTPALATPGEDHRARFARPPRR